VPNKIYAKLVAQINKHILYSSILMKCKLNPSWSTVVRFASRSGRAELTREPDAAVGNVEQHAVVLLLHAGQHVEP
jgi:hypothetical protein